MQTIIEEYGGAILYMVMGLILTGVLGELLSVITAF